MLDFAFRILPVTALLLVGGVTARAASITWDGGTDGTGASWSDAVNWSGDVSPGAADSIFFTATGTGGISSQVIGTGKVISLDASQSIFSLNISAYSNTTAFTIGSAADIAAGNTLTLTNVFRGDNNAHTQTIAANVVLAANSTWNIVNGYNGSVAVTGNISGDGMSLTKTGTNSLTFTGTNTYTGGTTISAGSLVLGDGTKNGFVAGAIVNNASLVFNNGSTQTSGDISGTGSMTKSGSGTLILGGATNATSTGSFTINGGGLDTSIEGLVLTNSSYAWNGDFTFAGTNSLDLGTGAVSLNANRVVTVNANTLAVGGVISGASRVLTKNGDGTLQLSAAGTYSGGTVINGGTIKLIDSGKIGTGNLTVNSAGTLTLDNTDANADRIADTAAVTLGGQLNLIGNDSAATSETAGAFTAGGSGSVITLTPGADQSALLTFSSLGARTVGGGATGLFRGTGLGSALGANTSNIIFTTAPTVTTLGAFAATDGVGDLGTANAAVLRGFLYDNTVTGSGIGFATYDALNGVRLLNAATEQSTTYAAGNENIRLDLVADVGITGAATNTLQLHNVSGGAKVVTNTGAGLAPQNGLLFTGSSAISLNGGTLNANTNTNNKEAIILSTNTAGVTIGTAITGDNITIGGSGDITLNGAVTGKTFTSNAVRINGTGTVTLAAAQTGALVINSGTLKLATGGSIYSGTSTSGTVIDLSVNRLGTFDLNGISATTNAFQGGGVITNSSETLATLSANYQPGGQNFNVLTSDFSGNITGNVRLSINAGGFYASRYTQVLSGDNSFTGGVAMSGGGQTLRLNSATALGTGTLTLASGAKLDGTNKTLTTNNLQTWNGAWTYTGASGSLNLGTGAVTLGANGGVTVSANTLTVGGNIGETGGARTFTKAGTGTLVLGGTNTHTGGTTVTAGTLTVNSGATLSGASAALAVNNDNTGAGTTVALNLNSAQTVGSLSGTIATPSSLTNAANINLSGASTMLTVNQTVANSFAGVITGTGGLTLGDGSNQALTLLGANTYTGTTTINGGSLIVNGSLASGSAVTVNTGGTLGGSGTIGGAVTVASGGFLAPGNSPGVLTVGSLNLAGGSTTSLEIGGAAVRGTDYDGITVSTASGLTYGGTLSLTFTSTLANLDSLDLFNFTGGAAGNFTSVVSTGDYAGTWTAGSGVWTFTGNDQLLTFDLSTGDLSVVASAVPEPSAYALIGGVLALAAACRRSRRRG